MAKRPQKSTQHGTPKFLKAMEHVAQVAEQEGPVAARVAFRDKMLELGHMERVRNLYRVQDKLSKKAVFLKLNGPQDTYLKTRKGRDIILKIRQVGFTTLSGVRGLDYALWEPNMRTGIMAHLQTVVATIFKDIIKFSYEWFKKDWGHLYSPTEDADSATTIGFKDDGLGRSLNTSMRVLFDFRGKTVHFLHVSEASRIEADRLVGSLQGVPANGEVIFESTPNGRGGEFFRQWQNWRNMGELAPYKGHFIPWFKFYPEVPEDWELPGDIALTSYERSLMEAFPREITKSHIAWRRWCVEANCQGDSEIFENEYPSNDIDCFFTGENLVFPSSVLKFQDSKTRTPAKIGFLLSEGPTKIVFHDDSKGTVFLWELPDPSTDYAIGADAAGGVGKDAAAAYVVNRKTGHYVAAIYGQIEPTDFGNELYKLGTFYNRAWINPESNNHGHVVIKTLTDKGYRNIYRRREFDSLTQKMTTKLGWLTTNESKLMLTENFKNATRDGKLIVLDRALIDEMSTFVQVASKTGRSVRREASSGAHDDRVMAAALTWEMHASRGITEDIFEQDAAEPESSGTFDADTGFAADF